MPFHLARRLKRQVRWTSVADWRVMRHNALTLCPTLSPRTSIDLNSSSRLSYSSSTQFLVTSPPLQLFRSNTKVTPVPRRNERIHDRFVKNCAGHKNFIMQTDSLLCQYQHVGVIAFSALTLLAGRQEEHSACKNWVMRCWCGCVSGTRCRLFAYGPADTIASQKKDLLPHLKPDWFYLSGTCLPRMSWKRGRWRGVAVVVVVVVVVACWCCCCCCCCCLITGFHHFVNRISTSGSSQKLYIGWQWCNFVPYLGLCQLIFTAIL